MTWKNSPVKTFFPDEFKRAEGSSDGNHTQRSVQLRQDDEIYSMLLSRASESFFDDDNDHGTPTSNDAHRAQTTDSQDADALSYGDDNDYIDRNSNNYTQKESLDGRENDSYMFSKYSTESPPRTSGNAWTCGAERGGARGPHQDGDARADYFENYVNNNVNSMHEAKKEEINENDMKIEYRRNEKLMSTDYQLLPYIDFLNSVEMEYPTLPTSQDRVDFTSCDVLASAVMEKVRNICL